MNSGAEPGMWQQFRRRRVTRSVITYLAVAFAVVEAAWSLIMYLQLPEWGSRAVLGAVVIGFPLAVVLAWTYDVTPEGIVKTPDDEGPDALDTHPIEAEWPSWWIPATGAVLVGLIVHIFRS